MRWERLFEDLEAEADEASRAERSAEVADRARREVGRQHLTDRVRAATGQELVIQVNGGGAVRGAVTATGSGWFLVDEPAGAQALVPTRHVLAVSGLGRRSAVPGSEGKVGARLGLGYALRGISRDRARVVVTLAGGGTLTGTIARVGADFLDLAPGETGGSEPVRALTTVPLDAVVLVRRAPA